MIRTPPFYATGTWRVKTPFSVDEDTVYICKAIRSVDDLEARGIDVYQTFYAPHGISRELFDTDVDSNVSIVTLMSTTKPTVYVPDTYILSYPDTTTMPYSHVVLSVSLGAVPDTLVFDDTREKIKEIVVTTLGVEPEVNVHVSGVLAEGIDIPTHQSIENQRLQRLENNRSLYGTLYQKDEEIAELKQKIALLEDILVNEGLVG